MILLDGNHSSKKRLESLKLKVAGHPEKPCLVVIRVGEDPASKIYVGRKIKACIEVGIESIERHLDASTTEEELLTEIRTFNENPKIHGILVQLPLPKHLSEAKVLESVDVLKDVDGFHPMNLGHLIAGIPQMLPCTPLGILNLLADYHIDVNKKRAVVVGRSRIVGRPVSLLLDQAGATVTVIHSKTPQPETLLKEADILVVAVGKPHFISTQALKPQVVILDVGINRLPSGKIVGDVDLERYQEIASAISPVPGGLGPMTICSLLENTWKCFQRTHLKFILGFALLCLSSMSGFAETHTDCSPEKSDTPQTRAAPVDFKMVVSDLKNLKSTDGRNVFTTIPSELEAALRPIFETDPSKISKLEQFFALVYYIGKFKTLPDLKLSLGVSEARKLLISSRVFSTPDFPEHLAGVNLFWKSHLDQAIYEVKFDEPELDLELNHGKGFASFKEGLCQIAKKLIFYGGFEFRVGMRSSKNVFVDEFKNLDLFGVFGSRGTVDVDIQYVSLKAVEFLKGSAFGIVRAKVSKKEFEKNQHSWLLRALSSLVTDKSTQPIDW